MLLLAANMHMHSCSTGAIANKKKEEQGLWAWRTAQKVLKDRKLEDLVRLQPDGDVLNADVQASNSVVVLHDALRNWGCCSCKHATQQSLCYHHVLVLLAVYPHIDTIVFSNHLLQIAGRKFGAISCCHRGMGGMQPLTDKLKSLEEEALKQFTPRCTLGVHCIAAPTRLQTCTATFPHTDCNKPRR
jgi:hypothetical protein